MLVDPMPATMPIWQLFVVHTAAIVAALVAAFFAWLTRRGVQNVHLSINSRMDALLEAARIVAFHEGEAAGRAQADARTDLLATQVKVSSEIKKP